MNSIVITNPTPEEAAEILAVRTENVKWSADRMHRARKELELATEEAADCVFLAVEAGLSRKQAAALAGVVPETIRRWVKNGG